MWQCMPFHLCSLYSPQHVLYSPQHVLYSPQHVLYSPQHVLYSPQHACYIQTTYVCLLCPQSHLDWKCEDVLRWLKAVHFEPYCDLFARHKVDGEKLDGLTRESLEEMGIADPFHLDNIVECINELCRKDSSRHYSIVSLCRLPFTFTT